MLGHGGMGVVWEAEEDETRRRVALKVMHSRHEADILRRRMFRRETEALARLEHPGIATLFDSGHTDDGHDYFAMEIVRGTTLDHWIAGRAEELDRDELENRLRLFGSICDAVHYAHLRGVVHRDIKPSNLVVTDDDPRVPGRSGGANGSGIKILDFGLASITDSSHQPTILPNTGFIQGTLQYMSPEQARCDERSVGVPSDVYSLGVVLYEMLTGVRPYDVNQLAFAKALQLICEKPPVPLKRNWAWSTKLDADLVTIVGKALEKDIVRRYSSVAELSEDVERFLSSQPIAARPPGAVYRTRRFSARFFERTVLAVVMIVVKAAEGARVALRVCQRAARPRKLNLGTPAWIDATIRVLRSRVDQPKR